MKMNELKMLLWKDVRLCQLWIITGIFFLVFPYLFYFIFYADFSFIAAWYMSTFLSLLTSALLSGNIITSERLDRSGEFLDFQGASRKSIITSKLTLCILFLVI